MPSALLPKRTAKPRTVGFIRLYVSGRAKPLRFNVSLRKSGAALRLSGAAGKPSVSMRRGALRVTRLPAGTAVAELTLYRVTKLDRATSPRIYTLKATVARGSAKPETFSAKPKPPR